MSSSDAESPQRTVVVVSSDEKPHPLDDLTADERTAAASAVKQHLLDAVFAATTTSDTEEQELRFNYVTLAEPPKDALLAYNLSSGDSTAAKPLLQREAEVLVSVPSRGASFKVFVNLDALSTPDEETEEAAVTSCEPIPDGCQPLFSPDDCDLAESIVKADPGVAELLKTRYGIDDLTNLVCDPWSVHIATPDFAPLRWRQDATTTTADGDSHGHVDDDVVSTIAPRLVQTFLYWRDDPDDNQYAKPIDVLPVVDLNAGVVVDTSFQPGTPPKISEASVNYHRAKLASNSYLSSVWRASMPPLDVVQPEGASFEVDGRVVTWDKWSLRVGFNYREGLVLHDVKYDGRPVVHRASLVEMAVPYADPNPPFERKCAFDVGDYGLGYCTNSLELGCDCLGNIHYFDVTLSDSRGVPYDIKKAICMHEEDHGVLWKHVEYRTGHSEARRSRRLVLSFIATVVNYEYLFYWYLLQDGTIEYEIKLSGMLSTNMLSAGEGPEPTHGTLVAPGVNAQVHQHMFCARLDMAVDGYGNNAVEEVDCVYAPGGSKGDYDNVFGPVSTPLTSEKQAARMADASKARAWKVTNPGKLNPITGKPVAGSPTQLTTTDVELMSLLITRRLFSEAPLTTNV